MRKNAHLPGLRGTSVRGRLEFLKEGLKVLRDPNVYSTDPVKYGQAYQHIFDAFEVWGWEKTGGDPNITHNMGRIQLDALAALYEEWEGSK
jgi:hypothetical protein